MNIILLKILTFFTSIFIAVHPVSHISINTSANVIKSPTNVVLTQSTTTPPVDCKPIIKTVIVYRNPPILPVVKTTTNSSTTATISAPSVPDEAQQIVLNRCKNDPVPVVVVSKQCGPTNKSFDCSLQRDENQDEVNSYESLIAQCAQINAELQGN